MKTTANNSSKYLLLFFIITFAWTWGFGFAPLALGLVGTPIGTFLFYFGGGAPSVTALFLVFLTYSKEEKRDYFRRCFSFRYMGLKWLVFIIIFFALISFLGLIISTKLLGLEMPGMDFLYAIIRNPVNILPILLISLLSGPLNEEFGWRGYSLDKLFMRFGFVGATLILGFLWGIWHLPWYFTPGQAQYDLLQTSPMDAILYIPSIMMLNFVVSYVYVKTKRSILAGALTHMFGNLLNSQLLSPYSVEVGMTIRVIKVIFCIFIALYCILSKRFQKEFENLMSEEI
ncbi:MAG: CPBP family intramembrane metalloprotease [Lachnospiraceae bacterium]|nr:CPBP family intramembrane metalloprotease [Lachnospiraceae bacterium]